MPFPRTPGGFAYSQAMPTFPRIGSRVRVTRSPACLDWPYHGQSGTVLGYSLPYGYAILAIDGEEVLIHPEGLEVTE
uniref:Uncharacterized protein n=1 Tax=viral metagenome TaxID=1070528 RepID=A0A6H2A1I5_9ZZZZ